MSLEHRSVHGVGQLPWVVALMGCISSPVLAQEPPVEGGSAASALSAPGSPPPSPAPASAPPPATTARSLAAPSGQASVSVTRTSAQLGPREGEPEHDAPEGDPSPMGWASLAFRVGIAAVKAGEITNPAYNPQVAAQAAQLPEETLAAYGYVGGGACTLLDQKCRTEGRFGVHLVAAMHLGGDGFGWDLEPYATFNASSQAYGLYTGPKFDIHVSDPLYLGFGFGLRAAYVQSDGWLLGADLGGRVPLHAVVYLTDDFALELDFGIGVGASGYMSKRVAITNPVTGAMIANAPRMTFGLARAWDLTIGVRFP